MSSKMYRMIMFTKTVTILQFYTKKFRTSNGIKFKDVLQTVGCNSIPPIRTYLCPNVRHFYQSLTTYL